MGIMERYQKPDDSFQSKSVDRKRVFERAWMYFQGNGATSIQPFCKALSYAWKVETELIGNNGFIYKPWVIQKEGA